MNKAVVSFEIDTAVRQGDFAYTRSMRLLLNHIAVPLAGVYRRQMILSC